MFATKPLSSILAGCFATALALSPLSAAGFSGSANKFTVSEPTEVPGLTLLPGTYTIQVVDHLSERYVVRIEGAKHLVHTTFLALADPAAPKPGSPGQALWQNASSGREYMRGWLFPGEGSVLEFVYPKGDAVAIAKSNNSKVPAIDPASEGRPPTIKGLSKSDLELVTLWLLSSTHVGPTDSSGGIQAERYPEVALANPPKPHITRLPQTASYLPWVGLFGAFSFAMALFTRFARGLTLRRVAQHSHAYNLASCLKRSE